MLGHRQIRGRRLAALSLAGCAVLAVSGCRLGDLAAGHGASRHATTRASGPAWADYLPVRSHRACTLSSHYHNNIGGTAIDTRTKTTSSYRDVRKAADGTHFTVHSRTRVTSRGETPNVTSTDLPYVLTDDGKLEAAPNLHLEAANGLHASYDKFVVYPTVRTLRRGASIESTALISVAPSDPSLEAELEKEVGARSAALRLTFRIAGVPPRAIHTSGGTFTDVVGVQAKIVKVSSPAKNSQIRQLFGTLPKLFGTFTTWYAKDVGPVKTQGSGGLMGGLVTAAPPTLTGCNPPLPASARQGPGTSGQPQVSPAPAAPPAPMSTSPSTGATAPDTPDERAAAGLSDFAGSWIGHTRSLSITSSGRGKESISDGCCDKVVDLSFQLSNPSNAGGTTRATAKVTSAHVHDRSAFGSESPPHVGDTGTLALEGGVLTESITDTNYCDEAQQAKGTCGA